MRKELIGAADSLPVVSPVSETTTRQVGGGARRNGGRGTVDTMYCLREEAIFSKKK